MKIKKLFEYFKFSRYALIEQENMFFVEEETLNTKKIKIINKIKDDSFNSNYLLFFNNKIKKELNHIKHEVEFYIIKINDIVFLKILILENQNEILIELIKTIVKK